MDGNFPTYRYHSSCPHQYTSPNVLQMANMPGHNSDNTHTVNGTNHLVEPLNIKLKNLCFKYTSNTSKMILVNQ